jgi:LPXTG-motif cell wall-anchored protein
MYQSRWVQDTDKNGKAITLNREDWAKEEKIYNADGTEKTSSGFTDMLTSSTSMAVVGILLVVAFGFVYRRK